MMNDRIQKISDTVRGDYYLKTAFSSGASLSAGCFFLVYNGMLGFLYGAVWNISICIYYVILTALRMNILFRSEKIRRAPGKKDRGYLERVFAVTHATLVVLDISMIAPVAEMALGHRNYSFGLIPAIAMAAYTTYRISAGIVNFKKSRHTMNIFVLELRTLNMIDALLAVLTLQNALIIANGGFEGGIRTLVLWTSAGILAAIAGITAASYHTGRRFLKDCTEEKETG